jgi:hypothetical protein
VAQVGTLGTSYFASNPPACCQTSGMVGFGAQPPEAQVASGFHPGCVKTLRAFACAQQ